MELGDVAVVTGAAGDIGAAICRRLAADGATVWALDRRAGQAASIQVDVTDSGAVDAAFARIEEREGRIDALVNAAGGPGGARHGLDEVSDQDWHAVTALNLDGVFHCTRAAVRAMKRAGGGSIVNISSGAGRTYSRTGVQAYAAAKAGVIGFTRQVARELGPAGIRVNCVAPGLIWAAPTRIEWERMSEAARERHLEGVALGRVGEPDDIAGPVAFFLSDDARYVTGQTISVDGGAVMLG
ncbi:SDR family NAD(P)-dependent oxidoreductase [Pseudonocardia acaciae]|uniref:SDR family NAD(P)-dependent oxidoreductase n=1 Tax=Pseudonocardia acaciae TaxID=551276 RepID=UPI00048BA570|nr:SDR family NAD(P)-dependent oxidoreductase [Pseudonocardia acaciae]